MVGNPDLTTYRYELDRALANVMPDTWAGHARMSAYEKSVDLPDEATEFAVTLANRLAQNERGASASSLATLAVKQAKDKVL